MPRETTTDGPGLGRTTVTALRRAATAVGVHGDTDRAAALTYHAVLSVFPGLLVLVSVFGLFPKRSTQPLVDGMTAMVPQPMRAVLAQAIAGLQESPGTASIMALVGVIGALWTASGYVAAFTRAVNAVYEVDEGRPAYRTVPLRLAVTVVVGVLLVASLAIVVFTGGLATRLGEAIGAGGTAVTVWGVVKWPVLLVLVAVIVTVLYWACPNARVGGPVRLAPGALLAVVGCVVASAGFAWYVANFASYNKTYGTLGGVIVFLVWLWLTNLLLLIGAEFNGQLQRARAARRTPGEPFAVPRDTRHVRAGIPAWTDRDVAPEHRTTGPDPVGDPTAGHRDAVAEPEGSG